MVAPVPRLAVRDRAPEMTPTRKMKAAIPRPSQKTGGIAGGTLPKARAPAGAQEIPHPVEARQESGDTHQSARP